MSDDYVLWSFVVKSGWFRVDRTRPASADGKKPAVTLADLEVEVHVRSDFARGLGRVPWFTITPSNVDLGAEWQGSVSKT